jgi:hypothetical protein
MSNWGNKRGAYYAEEKVTANLLRIKKTKTRKRMKTIFWNFKKPTSYRKRNFQGLPN